MALARAACFVRRDFRGNGSGEPRVARLDRRVEQLHARLGDTDENFSAVVRVTRRFDELRRPERGDVLGNRLLADMFGGGERCWRCSGPRRAGV